MFLEEVSFRRGLRQAEPRLVLLPISKALSGLLSLRCFTAARFGYRRASFLADSPSKDKVTCAINGIKLSQSLLVQLPLPDEHAKFIKASFVQVSPTWFASQRIQ